jgi:hypothetical protein
LRAGWRSSRLTVTEAAVGIPPDQTSENTLLLGSSLSPETKQALAVARPVVVGNMGFYSGLMQRAFIRVRDSLKLILFTILDIGFREDLLSAAGWQTTGGYLLISTSIGGLSKMPVTLGL